MVLVYEEEDYGVMTFAEVTRREMRRVFQENLVKEGLELELEEKQVSRFKLWISTFEHWLVDLKVYL